MIPSVLGPSRIMSPLGQSAGKRFKPTDVGGCILWLDAADLATGVVTTWPDKSGLARDVVQATGAKQPSAVSAATPSGGKAVRFNGTSHAMADGSFTALATATIYVVLSASSLGGNNQVFSGKSSTFRKVIFQTGGKWSIYANGAVVSGATAVAGTWVVIETFWPGTPSGQSIDVNGGTATSGGAGSASLDGYVIGADFSLTANYYAGDVAEVVAYDTVLGATDAAAVRAYLGSHAGITVL